MGFLRFQGIRRAIRQVKFRELAVDGLFVAGVAVFAVGLGMIYLPLAPIVGGLALVGIALVLR